MIMLMKYYLSVTGKIIPYMNAFAKATTIIGRVLILEFFYGIGSITSTP